MIFIAHLLPYPRGVNQNAITRQIDDFTIPESWGVNQELRLLEAPVRQELIAASWSSVWG